MWEYSHQGLQRAEALDSLVPSSMSVGVPQYRMLAELHTMMGTLDGVLRSSREDALKLSELPPKYSHQQEIHDRFVEISQDMQEEDQIRQLKQYISHMRQQIIDLRGSSSRDQEADSSRMLYVHTYRLHSIAARLNDELRRQSTGKQQLEFVYQKQNEEAIRLRYFDQQLTEAEHRLTKELEELTIDDYESQGDPVKRAKYQQLMSIRQHLSKSSSFEEAQYHKLYAMRVNKLLPILEETKTTDAQLEQIDKAILKQRLELRQLESTQGEDMLQDFSIDKITVNVISSSGTKQSRARVKTELDSYKDATDRKHTNRTVKMNSQQVRMSNSEETLDQLDSETSKQLQRQQKKPGKDSLRLYDRNKLQIERPKRSESSLPLLSSDEKIVSNSSNSQQSQTPKHRITRREFLEHRAEIIRLAKINTIPESSYNPKHRLSTEEQIDTRRQYQSRRRRERDVLSPIVKPPFRNILHLP